MELRRYRPKDLHEVVQLYYETINSVNIKDYSKEQIKVWSDAKENLLHKKDFFLSLYTIVAMKNDIIIGYGNIDDFGYLDHLYVHKDFQGLKTATAICDELENYVFIKGIRVITVHASISAKPFFINRGYKVVKEQEVERQGIKLTNYLMEKDLNKY